MSTTRAWHLMSRPSGLPTMGNFAMKEAVPDGFTLDPDGLPAELQRRLVLAIFAAMERPAPRGEAVTRLLATLGGGGSATLAEVKCAGGSLWRFTPAPPRRARGTV